MTQSMTSSSRPRDGLERAADDAPTDETASDVPAPLRTERLAAKLFLAEGVDVDVEQLIPIFHRWIREKTVPGLLIDVADYKHVQGGPGVMLIAHEANYGLDLASPGPGLLVTFKRDVPEDPRERFTELLRYLRRAADALEAEAVLGLRFDRSRMLFRIHDRLRAPVGRATFEAVAPVVAAWTERATGAAPASARGADEPGRPFGLWLHLPA